MSSGPLLALLRHGESRKNLIDCHGGQGLPLTELGRRQIESAGKLLAQLGMPRRVIHYHAAIVQVSESAKLLASCIEADLKESSGVRPLGLGVLDGRTREEASRDFPVAAARMEQWRAGELEAHQLHIPEGEDLGSFWRRGNAFVSQVRADSGLHVVVGTRSILTLLISILLGRSIEAGGGYRHISIPCGGMVTFAVDAEAAVCLDYLCTFRP